MSDTPTPQSLSSVFDDVMVTPAQGAEILQYFMRGLSDPTLLAALRDSVDALLYNGSAPASKPATAPVTTSTSSTTTSSKTT